MLGLGLVRVRLVEVELGLGLVRVRLVEVELGLGLGLGLGLVRVRLVEVELGYRVRVSWVEVSRGRVGHHSSAVSQTQWR